MKTVAASKNKEKEAKEKNIFCDKRNKSFFLRIFVYLFLSALEKRALELVEIMFHGCCCNVVKGSVDEMFAEN